MERKGGDYALSFFSSRLTWKCFCRMLKWWSGNPIQCRKRTVRNIYRWVNNNIVSGPWDAFIFLLAVANVASIINVLQYDRNSSYSHVAGSMGIFSWCVFMTQWTILDAFGEKKEIGSSRLDTCKASRREINDENFKNTIVMNDIWWIELFRTDAAEICIVVNELLHRSPAL